jgi:hypothetical protein
MTRSKMHVRVESGRSHWQGALFVKCVEKKDETMSSGAFNKAVSLYAQLTADNRLKVWDVASGSSKQE